MEPFRDSKEKLTFQRVSVFTYHNSTWANAWDGDSDMLIIELGDLNFRHGGGSFGCCERCSAGC